MQPGEAAGVEPDIQGPTLESRTEIAGPTAGSVDTGGGDTAGDNGSEAGSDVSISQTYGHSPLEVAVEIQADGEVSCASADAIGDGDSEQIRAFEVVRRWIADTGCGKDMISRKHARAYEHHLIEIQPVRFGTANGVTEANEGLPITIPELDMKATPYVMASTPALMSVGMRVEHHSFVWLPHRTLCFITPFPNPQIVPLLVIGDIPYSNFRF